MSFSPSQRSWFARLNPFARRAEQAPSRRSTASPLSFRPSLETLEGRMLLSPTLVTNTTVFPARAVVEIFATYPNGRMDQGTGTMVNPNTVLTAGHMIYNSADGGWAKSIEVIPGRTGNREPYGIASMTSEETFSSFIADDKRNPNEHSPGDGDVGFISLNRNVGYKTGWLGVLGTLVSNSHVSKYGYPGTNGYKGTQMYDDSGRLNARGAGTVPGFAYWGWSTSSMSAIPGQSGSSLIYKLNGKVGIIGVQDVGTSSEGYAEVMTPTVVNALTSFEKAHPATGRTVSSAQLGTQPAVSVGSDFGTTTAAEVGYGNLPPTSTCTASPSPILSPQLSPPAVAPQPPSPVQLFLDGINLAIDLSGPGDQSAALADAALIHDRDAALGGWFNPYVDAGLAGALSELPGNHNS